MSSSTVHPLPFSTHWEESTMPEAATDNTASLPKKLFGYEVVGFLGHGAGSVIYAASDPADNQLYALKHVVVKTEKDTRFVDQLVNEFDTGSKLSHPLLRRCIDVKVTRTMLRKPTEAILIMELVEGTSCDIRPPAHLAAIVGVLKQTISALGALHAQGFVHCDLKPNNILITSDGRVKLIDLGQACAIGSVKKRIQGTPDFISPEQVRREPVSTRTDVYNLGATFYWMLTGRKLPTLFTLKKSPNSFLLSDAIPQPHELNAGVPMVLSTLIMECVRTVPARRPDMAEVGRRVEIIQHSLAQQATGAATLAS
jgi:eukaryotic-like serine/threonine-protein kinase